ncbi:MAG: reverse transcriptase family protein [Flavobacteriales bacterium]
MNYIEQKVEELGCSSLFKKDIIEYASNLHGKGLPVVFSLTHLARMFDVPSIVLTRMIQDRARNYKTFKIRKKHGGHRVIMSPVGPLKVIQSWVLGHILEKVIVNEECCGFVKGKNIATNALPHVGQEAIMNIDLYRFFDTITEQRVYGLFKWLGYHRNLAVSLAQLLTAPLPYGTCSVLEKENVFSEHLRAEDCNRLPQGSPASPMISNLVAYALDIRLRNLAAKRNCKYTRYADDLTFSGAHSSLPSLDLVSKIIEEEGFYLNPAKTRISGRRSRQEVTGLTVNDGVRVDTAFKKRVRTELYHCVTHGGENHQVRMAMVNPTAVRKSNFKDHLLGKICFINAVEPELGKKFLLQYNQIDWTK